MNYVIAVTEDVMGAMKGFIMGTMNDIRDIIGARKDIMVAMTNIMETMKDVVGVMEDIAGAMNVIMGTTEDIMSAMNDMRRMGTRGFNQERSRERKAVQGHNQACPRERQGMYHFKNQDMLKKSDRRISSLPLGTS